MCVCCVCVLPVSRTKTPTHLSVSVADGLSEGAPPLSVLHLHRCIVGQQQVSTFCKCTDTHNQTGEDIRTMASKKKKKSRDDESATHKYKECEQCTLWREQSLADFIKVDCQRQQ